MFKKTIQGVVQARKWLVVALAVSLTLVLLCWIALDLPLRLSARSTSDEMLTHPDPDRIARMRSLIEELTAKGERASHESQIATADHLRNRVQEMGYSPWTQEYEYMEKTWTNIIVTESTLEAGDEFIVLMAHFDSIGWGTPPRAPGADDNGSGIAVLMELARRFQGIETALPLMFCFFSNEEVGLRGSRAFVEWSVENNIAIRAAINVDVVGYSRPKQLIDVETISAQGWPRARLGAVLTQFRNAHKAHRNGRNALLVAGKPENEYLVKIVSRGLAIDSALSVAPLVWDDCG